MTFSSSLPGSGQPGALQVLGSTCLNLRKVSSDWYGGGCEGVREHSTKYSPAPSFACYWSSPALTLPLPHKAATVVKLSFFKRKTCGREMLLVPLEQKGTGWLRGSHHTSVGGGWVWSEIHQGCGCWCSQRWGEHLGLMLSPSKEHSSRWSCWAASVSQGQDEHLPSRESHRSR